MTDENKQPEKASEFGKNNENLEEVKKSVEPQNEIEKDI